MKKSIGSLFPATAKHIAYSDKSIGGLIEESDLVAYNTSSSAYEALMMLKPVICVLPNNMLNFNRVPSELSREVRSKEEIAKAFTDMRDGRLELPPFDKLPNAISPVDVNAFERALS